MPLFFSSARERRRQNEIALIKREQSAQRDELARQRAEAKLWVEEQRELARKQMRLDREQEKQAAELERQAKQLAKHEEEIAKLKYNVAKCQFDIEHLNALLEDLNESFEVATNVALTYRNAGNLVKEEQAKRRIVTIRNQIHSAETKLCKAQFDMAMAQHKLSA